MTADSLKAALTLTPAEVTAIKPQYDSINVILKQAATVRDSVRSAMQGMQGMSQEDRRAAWVRCARGWMGCRRPSTRW